MNFALKNKWIIKKYFFSMQYKCNLEPIKNNTVFYINRQNKRKKIINIIYINDYCTKSNIIIYDEHIFDVQMTKNQAMLLLRRCFYF